MSYIKALYMAVLQWQPKVVQYHVCITTNQADTKSNYNFKGNHTTKQHAIVNI